MDVEIEEQDIAPLAEDTPTDAEMLQAEMAILRAEVARLNNHRFVRIHSSTFKLLWFQFIRGLAFGLGSVIGATFLVSMLVYWLGNIDFIPILGEWGSRIADEIQSGR